MDPKALSWAKQNPNDPRSKQIQMKAWADDHPDDPRSKQLLAKLSQSQNPLTTRDAADKAASNGKPTMQPGETAESNHWAQTRDKIANGSIGEKLSGVWDVFNHRNPNAEGDDLGAAALAIPAEAAPAAIQKLAAYLGGTGFGPAAARIGANTAIGAGQGAYNHPEDRLGAAKRGAIISGGLSTAAETLAPALSKSADWLQQKAMGMKKFDPGVGSEAIDQGIRGSKAQMASQADATIDDLGEQAGVPIGKLGRVDSSAAAKPVQDYASSMKVGDIVPGHSADAYKGALGRGEEIASRGQVDASKAWQLAQLAGKAGYRNQTALQSEDAYLAQLEQQGYSNSLKEQFAKENPGAPNEVENIFAKISKIYKANQALAQPDTIRKGMPLTNMAAAGLGLAKGGPVGAAVGYGAAAASRSPLVQSYGAAGLDAAGAGTQALGTPGMTQYLQSLFSGQNSSSK